MQQVSIEVVYALPNEQTLMSLLVDEGATVEQAIAESGICHQYPEIDLQVNKVGIWNKAVKLQQVVQDGDRIEIYRPLIADPKEVRKRRAEKAKLEGRADKVTGGRVNPLRGSNDSGE
ncbi:RnfH family protein [Thalassotalea ponticola]|uniref:RnfH family protein n=1 Tax=Thalassotalea ponticola TaxID=1523392 RepID=UPI0025B41373|nr:RnfH family protein [Thalassotalea ponticola]MDN3651685.1 RnfH family protein [Thalassotalea ponticola]